VYGEEQVAIADALLKAGARIQAKAFGVTVLHLAASKGYVDVAGLFIERGADVNEPVKMAGGIMTPLAAAVRAKQLKMEEFLKQHSAHI
jgi:ankyrin repeat protein